MATYFVGMNAGDQYGTPPATGTTTTGKDIEVAINTTANITNVQQAITLLETIKTAILKGGKAW